MFQMFRSSFSIVIYMIRHVWLGCLMMHDMYDLQCLNAGVTPGCYRCSLRTMLNPVVILLPSSLAFHHDISWMYAQFSRSSKFCLVCSSILHSVDTSHMSVIPLCFLCVLPLLLSPFCSVCSLRGWLWWTIRTVPIHSYNSFIGLVL